MPIQQTFRSISQDLTTSLKDSLVEIYPADGVDHLDKTINGSTEDYATDEGKAYYKNNLTIFAGFLGLPNRKLQKHSGQSVLNLLRNFVGWQEDASVGRNVVNGLIMTPINIVTTPVKLALNVLRVGTEVAPNTLAKLFLTLGYGLVGDGYMDFRSMLRDQDKGFAAKSGLGLLYLATMATGVVVNLVGFTFAFLHSLGAYLTSPLASIRNAWKLGRQGGGIVGALVLSTLAVLGVVTMYAVAVPLLAQVALPLMPYVARLPEPILNVINAISIAVEPALTVVGSIMMPVVSFIGKAMTLGLVDLSAIMTSMPAVVGLGALFGGFLATVGTPISSAIHRFKEKWHAPKNHPHASEAPAASPANVAGSEAVMRRSLQAGNGVENKQQAEVVAQKAVEQQAAPAATITKTPSQPNLFAVKSDPKPEPAAEEQVQRVSNSK